MNKKYCIFGIVMFFFLLASYLSLFHLGMRTARRKAEELCTVSDAGYNCIHSGREQLFVHGPY